MMYEVGGRVFALVVIHDDAGLSVSLSDMGSGEEVGRIDVDAQDVELGELKSSVASYIYPT